MRVLNCSNPMLALTLAAILPAPALNRKTCTPQSILAGTFACTVAILYIIM